MDQLNARIGRFISCANERQKAMIGEGNEVADAPSSGETRSIDGVRNTPFVEEILARQRADQSDPVERSIRFASRFVGYASLATGVLVVAYLGARWIELLP